MRIHQNGCTKSLITFIEVKLYSRLNSVIGSIKTNLNQIRMHIPFSDYSLRD